MRGDAKFPERNAEIIRRRKAGELPRHIAKTMGITRNVVIGVLGRAGLCEPDGQRTGAAKGSEVGTSKLTEEAVRIIRDGGEYYKIVAERYGIAEDYVFQIRRREVWKHVP